MKKIILVVALLAIAQFQLQAANNKNGNGSVYKLTAKEKEFLEAAKTGKAGTIKTMLRNRMTDQRFGRPVLDIDVWSSADEEGLTALMLAARFEHPTIVRLLIDAGANVKEKNLYDATALHLAGNSAQIVNMLVKAGLNKNAKDEHGDTPLMYAADFNFMDKAKALIQAGANPTLKNNEGLTAEAIARQNYGDTALAKYLAKEATAWK